MGRAPRSRGPHLASPKSHGRTVRPLGRVPWGSAANAARGLRQLPLTTHDLCSDRCASSHLAAAVTSFSDSIGLVRPSERTGGEFAPAPAIAVPAIVPDRKPWDRVSTDRLAHVSAHVRASAHRALVPCSNVASSPPHRCPVCQGRGRVFEIEAQPPSAGIPQQVEDGRGVVLLEYFDGTDGIVKVWRCGACDATGLRPRFGPCDVRLASTWAAQNGIRLPEPCRTQIRGSVVPHGGRVEDAIEGDALSGEFFVSADTRTLPEASTSMRIRENTG